MSKNLSCYNEICYTCVVSLNRRPPFRQCNEQYHGIRLCPLSEHKYKFFSITSQACPKRHVQSFSPRIALWERPEYEHYVSKVKRSKAEQASKQARRALFTAWENGSRQTRRPIFLPSWANDLARIERPRRDCSLLILQGAASDYPPWWQVVCALDGSHLRCKWRCIIR